MMILGVHEQPYLTLQWLKLRALREELRGRSTSLTNKALDLATELWLIEDISRFKKPDRPDPTPWPFRMA